MKLREWWMTYGVVITILIVGVVVPVIIISIWGGDSEYRAACEERGGVMIRGRDFRACVDPAVLR